MNLYSSPIVGEDEVVQRMRYFVPRPSPSPIPTPNIFDEPTVCLKINAEWAVHFRGVFEALDQPDTWIGTDEEIFLARQQLLEAFVMFMGECELCCAEELEKLTELVTLNTTIVTNLTTVVNNQQTTIDNQKTINLVNQYNDFQTVNQSVYQLNQTFYDGTPESIAPNIGATWNDAPDDTGDAALCEAVKRYVEQAIYQETYNVNNTALVLGGAADATVALALGLSTVTAGVSAAIGLVMAGINLAVGTTVHNWNQSVTDPSAKRKVMCCMYDHLKDQVVSAETFKASVEDCEFDVGTNESNVAALIHVANQKDDSFVAFLRAMNDTQGQGSIADCDCCNEVESYVIVGLNGTTATRVNDYQWELVTTTSVPMGLSDPFCGGDDRDKFTLTFKEEFGRCFDIIAQSNTSQGGYKQIGCDGIEIEGVGGGGGAGTYFEWWTGPCAGTETEYRTTITIACPSD